MAKIKILYVITKSNLGGAQRYVLDLATNLPQADFEVTVVLGGQGTLTDKLVEAGIRVISLEALKRDVNIFSDLKSFFELVDIFRQEQPRLIHLNSSKAAGLGVVAAWLVNLLNIFGQKPTIKTIFTLHGLTFNEDRPRLAKKIIAVLHWFTILLTDATITVAEATKNQIKHWPLIGEKTRLIPNGLKMPELVNQVIARKTLLPSETRKIWLGTIAELHRNKGLDYLIKAFALIAPRHPEIILVIIGAGEERLNLEQQIADHKLTGRVHLIGYRDQASQYLQAFDIFALTSRTESLPYVLLEAGLARRVVIATDVGGVKEIIKNQKTGCLVSPRDPQTIATGLEFLLTNTQNHLFSEALYKHVNTNFNLEQMVRKTLEIYRQFVKI